MDGCFDNSAALTAGTAANDMELWRWVECATGISEGDALKLVDETKSAIVLGSNTTMKTLAHVDDVVILDLVLGLVILEEETFEVL